MIDSAACWCSDNLNSSILTQSNGLLMDGLNCRPYCTETLHWFFATCCQCVSQVNVDNQHVHATNILIIGSKLDWVNFGHQALTICRINASSQWKEIPCGKTSQRQMPSTPLPVNINGVKLWKKVYFQVPASGWRMSYCATVLLSFSWNAVVCSSCVIRCRCKV